MNEVIRLIKTNRSLFFLIALLWVFILIVASVIYRRLHGKAIHTSKPKNSLYYEGWASGHSNRNIFTKLEGLSRCLLVAVTPDSLIVQPRFPFNLMFMPEIYDLEYHISGLKIITVEKKGWIFKSVDIEFIDKNDITKSVTLYLKKSDEFLTAIGKISPIAAVKISL